MNGGGVQIPQQSLGMAAAQQQMFLDNQMSQSQVSRSTSPSMPQFSLSASVDDSFEMDNCSVAPLTFSRNPSEDFRLQFNAESMVSGYGAVRGVSPGCGRSRYNPMDGD